MTSNSLGGIRMAVFDLDDTLFLEQDYIRSGFLAVEAATGFRGFAATAWDSSSTASETTRSTSHSTVWE